jgi:hypothetical protein
MGWVTDEAGLKETKETYAKRRKTYLKTFPYFCSECSSFFYSFRYEKSKKESYCENCGSIGSIRKATKLDYDMVFKDKQEKTEYKPSRKTDIYKYWEKDAAKKRAKKVSPTKKVKSGILCVNCGKPLLSTWNICAYCGQKQALQESSPISEVKPVKKPPAPSHTPLKAQKKEELEKKIVQIKTIKLYKSKQLKEEHPKPVEKTPKQPISQPISKEKAEPEKTEKLEPKVITCPFCNSQIDVKQNYCQYCGYILKK